MPLPHCEEIRRLAIAAPNINPRAVLQKFSNDVGMAPPGGIGECRQARVGFLVVYVCDVESLAQIAHDSTMPATSSGYQRTKTNRACTSCTASGALDEIPQHR
jgi:hypothetical protein